MQGQAGGGGGENGANSHRRRQHSVLWVDFRNMIYSSNYAANFIKFGGKHDAHFISEIILISI